VAADDIDAIDICTPNNLHAEIAIEAAKHGKAILCEKPLSMDVAEGEKMCAAVEKAGVPNTVWYNYRRIPAVTFAKNIIDSGKLGRIFHYRANFLQDWTINADLETAFAGVKLKLDKTCEANPLVVLHTPEPVKNSDDASSWQEGVVQKWEGDGFAVKTQKEKAITLP
jgi:predicted dehydrogenase